LSAAVIISIAHADIITLIAVFLINLVVVILLTSAPIIIDAVISYPDSISTLIAGIASAALLVHLSEIELFTASTGAFIESPTLNQIRQAENGYKY
jgi:hypothetical protein